MRSFLILSSIALGASVNVAYFREELERMRELNVTGATKSAALLFEYEDRLTIFDSPAPVYASRVVVRGMPGETVTLFSLDGGLSTAAGVYVFANTSYAVRDASTNASVAVLYYDAVAWLSAGSAVRFDVDVDASGASMLFFVSSGRLDFDGSSSSSSEASSLLETLVGKTALADNSVAYSLSATCYNGATHFNTPNYSNLDEPIGPLPAHYHTRGALYYVLYGSAKFNDAGVANDVLKGGEIRFVNAGVFYGPEEMDESSSFVTSLHEPDPSKIVKPSAQRQNAFGSPSTTTQCPFACFRNASGAALARCLAA